MKIQNSTPTSSASRSCVELSEKSMEKSLRWQPRIPAGTTYSTLRSFRNQEIPVCRLPIAGTTPGLFEVTRENACRSNACMGTFYALQLRSPFFQRDAQALSQLSLRSSSQVLAGRSDRLQCPRPPGPMTSAPGHKRPSRCCQRVPCPLVHSTTPVKRNGCTGASSHRRMHPRS